MINLLNEYELAFGVLPNEPDSNQVIYIENHKNIKLEWYIKGHLSELKKMFRSRGLEFIYLPELVDCIDDDDLINAARYYAPWLKSTDLQALRDACKISIEQLYENVDLKDDVPAVVNGKGRAFKVDVKDSNPDLLYVLFDQMAEAYSTNVRHKAARFYNLDFSSLDPSFAAEERCQRHVSESPTISEPENPLDDEYFEADRLYRELKNALPGWAVEAILAAQLRKDEVTSSIVINNPRKLFLPEYNIEIGMTPATMAFYLLYLKHPEGIKFKDLVDYRDELYKFYNFTTRSGDKQAIERTVDVMVAQIDGNQDVQRSRIKAAIRNRFRAQICERYAQTYYLDGKRGEPMKIAVAGVPGKVIWKVDL